MILAGMQMKNARPAPARMVFLTRTGRDAPRAERLEPADGLSLRP